MATAVTARRVKWKTTAPKPPTSRKQSTQASARTPAVSSPEVPQPVKLIANERELQSFLARNSNTFAPAGATIVGVHFQFAAQRQSDVNQNEPDRVVAIVISSPVPGEVAVLLLVASLSETRIIAGLRTLLSDPAVVKVMHSVHRIAYWLHCYGMQGPTLVNCVDLQLLYESAVDSTVLNADILQIATRCSPEPATDLAHSLHSFKARMNPSNSVEWTSASLPDKLQRSLAQTAKLYASCYLEFRCNSEVKASCVAMTSSRWEFAVINEGHSAIWFDPATDNLPRSLECLVWSAEGASAVDVPELELQCELESLLDLLPRAYRDAILEVDNYRSRLRDICIDFGRPPFAYFGKKERISLGRDGRNVSKETVDNVIRNLGGEMRIGGDNRAGIDRQLHRISVMRSKTDEVFGFTMRVGRALRNSACVLTDLLLSEKHADKSVLVLGHPGSGKTTLIRDVARCVSETMENVCIIDTSNEIGGDGLVPHECVGWARRMMVPSLEAQAGVMVECVQNHTVETLIVDEIGRKAEVLAASTVRQRGPRLIASAHGDFRALIKNPDLKGLVGGSQQVTVGDAVAKTSNSGKLQTQRAGNPVFDMIVELDRVVRGRCRVIWDVAKAVDSVLKGDNYSFETRRWDTSTRGVQVLR
ncbi:BTB and MATH domain-containing protein 41 [Phytophthora pseudosyringae]|uniref:BTB and MATH domain-containing protein 41 n=1 Tax=Phytophthora pseudosyringae TaxID=221518 RepID=A0A8T1VCA3_9STRA|nr:BTB and MATH domain-containing protein 41 [Phytophthora pseudosyringae]